MAVDHIRYDLLTQDAMRGVVRRVLKDAASKGLAGEHHFFISFATRSPGVKLSSRLQAQYAEEMTIVLQHQFWDLSVTDDAFEVGLSFNGIPERLTIPFSAIKGFFDPSVNFGLQFAPGRSSSGEVEPQKLAPAAEKPPVEDSGQPAPPSDSRHKTLPAPAEVPAPVDEDPDKPAGGAEVVRLDRFRKK